MTSNQHIANVLNHSKKFEIGAMKEDLCIKNYIQKKYFTHLFKNKGGNGYNITPQVLQEIKDSYFSEALSKSYNMPLEQKEYIFDQIQDIEKIVNTICEEMKQKLKDAKVDIYQFDSENIVISPDMKGDNAIEYAKAEARKGAAGAVMDRSKLMS